MTIKKNYFILIIVVGILYVPALGGTELPELVKGDLLAPANPALTEIEWLGLSIQISETKAKEAEKDGLAWKELLSKVESKLGKAGIETGTPFDDIHELGPPAELKFDIDMLKLGDSQKYVFRIQTLLARMVNLPEHHFHIKADVWKTQPVMQVVPIEDMPAKITNAVLEHVDAFIIAYSIARPQSVQLTDANDTTIIPSRQVTNEYKYVASKNSKVFHRPDCRWTKKISPENLVGYNSRDEAIAAGKRPCQSCQP